MAESEEFKPLDQKEAQKRASIVAELYNDISSSDDDEEEEAKATPATEESKAAPAKTSAADAKKQALVQPAQ